MKTILSDTELKSYPYNCSIFDCISRVWRGVIGYETGNKVGNGKRGQNLWSSIGHCKDFEFYYQYNGVH